MGDRRVGHMLLHFSCQPCTDGVLRFSWSGDGIPVSLTDYPTRLYVASVANTSTGGVALLGEQGKVAMISTYRFASIIQVAGSGLGLTLRGAVGENVTLLIARAEHEFKIERTTVQIGPGERAYVQVK
jgi:hypothetical protein